MTELVLLRPWWLAALPLLALLGLLSWRRGAHAGGWQKIMPPVMLEAMQKLGHLDRGTSAARLSCLFAAAVLAAGLSGPSVPRQDAPVLAGSGAILIALDMSRSISEGPALADAQVAAAQVLAAANGRPAGLILFNGEAYDIAARTLDPSTLETQIAVLSPETMPGQGSRPAAAFALARDMLSKSPDSDLVLITDGGGIDTATITEAERLTGSGVRILVLTVSGSAGPTVPPDALEKLEIYAIIAAADAPEPVLQKLSAPSLGRTDPVAASLRFLDLGPFLCILAMFPLLSLFRRAA